MQRLTNPKFKISVFRLSREAGEICAPLGNYVTYGGNSLPAFRDKLWDRICPKTSVNNYQYSLCNFSEERRPETQNTYFEMQRIYAVELD